MYRTSRPTYKPFSFPWAFDFYELQNKLHWLPSEVSMSTDVAQWKTKLTESEKHMLTQVQLFLAQADNDIASVYVSKYLPNLPLPEMRMALLSIANIEAVHMHSYSYTIDTLGMPESSYSAFLNIPEMYDKHVFITEKRKEQLYPVQSFMLDVALCSGFGEGMQLFSAFAIILSFMRRGLMNGLGTLTRFIARDEDLHCHFMMKVFNTIKEQHPDDWNDKLKSEILRVCQQAVALEDHFIDLAFQLTDVENLKKSEVHFYIRYIANKRLASMGLSPLYKDCMTNPLPWMDEMISASEHANFFETRATSYSKANFTGSWDEAWTNV